MIVLRPLPKVEVGEQTSLFNITKFNREILERKWMTSYSIAVYYLPYYGDFIEKSLLFIILCSVALDHRYRIKIKLDRPRVHIMRPCLCGKVFVRHGRGKMSRSKGYTRK